MAIPRVLHRVGPTSFRCLLCCSPSSQPHEVEVGVKVAELGPSWGPACPRGSQHPLKQLSLFLEQLQAMLPSPQPFTAPTSPLSTAASRTF